MLAACPLYEQLRFSVLSECPPSLEGAVLLIPLLGEASALVSSEITEFSSANHSVTVTGTWAS